MDQAIEDGICQCRIVDESTPLLDRHLPGDNSRATAYTIIQNFQQVVAAASAEWRPAKVVEDQQLSLASCPRSLPNEPSA